MDMEQLKEFNKPENLVGNYNLTLPFYGLPPETLKELLILLTGIAQGQVPMQEEIAQLPTWQNLKEGLYPQMQRLDQNQVTRIENSTRTITRELQRLMEEQTGEVKRTIGKKTSQLEDNLKARDLSPMKLRLMWMGWGALALTTLYALLTIFKIL